MGAYGASMKESRSLTEPPHVSTTRAMPGPTTGENIRFFLSFWPVIAQSWVCAKSSVHAAGDAPKRTALWHAQRPKLLLARRQ